MRACITDTTEKTFKPITVQLTFETPEECRAFYNLCFNAAGLAERSRHRATLGESFKDVAHSVVEHEKNSGC